MVNGLKILQALKNRLWGRFPQISYSRSGEDLVLEELFRGVMDGFYIDIGAYHPKEFSNTYKYYLNGWSGINIDANANAISLFKKQRSRDINLFAAISDIEEDKTFYKFKNDPSMNTISESFANDAIETYKLEIESKNIIKTRRLDSILDELKINKPIDFISIDVEGHDLQVLKSNNWKKYRAKAILIETEGNINTIKPEENEIVGFLSKLNYRLIAFTFVNFNVGNLIFVDGDVIKHN